MPRSRTYYDILKVARNAGIEDTRAAFKLYFLKFHPNNHPGDKRRAKRFMQVITEAYSVLSDPLRREVYDDLIAANSNNDNQDQDKSFEGELKLNHHQDATTNSREIQSSDESPPEAERIVTSNNLFHWKFDFLFLTLAILVYIGWIALDQADYLATTNGENINKIKNSYVFDFDFENKCRHSITLAIRYKNLEGDWIVNGWWDVGSGESVYLENENGKRLISAKPKWYYYARTLNDMDLEWKGKYQFAFAGELLSMIEIEDSDGDWFISCR